MLSKPELIINVTESEIGLVEPEVHNILLDIAITMNKFHLVDVSGKHINKNAFKFDRPFRDFIRANFIELYTQLSNIDWSPVYLSSGTNEAVVLFYNLIYNVLNSTVPYKSNSMSRKLSNYPEWL